MPRVHALHVRGHAALRLQGIVIEHGRSPVVGGPRKILTSPNGAREQPLPKQLFDNAAR